MVRRTDGQTNGRTIYGSCSGWMEWERGRGRCWKTRRRDAKWGVSFPFLYSSFFFGMCVCGLINIYSRQEHQRVVVCQGSCPFLSSLPFHPPLTFSLQPQVLQLEYLYADALSTCSSCFPSFTLVPLLPLPCWLPLSLILSLFPSLPISPSLSLLALFS